MNYAAIHSGSGLHLLDHIAPLAHVLKAPLFIEEEKILEMAQRYYPQIALHSFNPLQLEPLLSFDVLFNCQKWQPHFQSLLRDLYQKEMRLVYCPHGQSDKQAPYLSYGTQDAVLVYGKLQLDMLKKLKQHPKIWSILGNYRLNFYQTHKTFYDHLAHIEIFSKLNPENPTLLYAPTWADIEQGSSFFEWAPALFDELPSSWNLLVKVHPLLEQQKPAHYYKIITQLEKKTNAVLIDYFPPIYPILSKIDAYLGDTSSIGYDCLAFDMPLFFLDVPSLKQGFLHKCGSLISDKKNIYRQIEQDKKKYSIKKQTLYKKAFS
jgi:hypothetical protein